MKWDSQDMRSGRQKMTRGFQELLEGVEESLHAARRGAHKESERPRARLRESLGEVQHWADDMGSTVKDTYHEAKGQAGAYAREAGAYAREHPAAVASLVALGAGVLLACLMLQRR